MCDEKKCFPPVLGNESFALNFSGWVRESESEKSRTGDEAKSNKGALDSTRQAYKDTSEGGNGDVKLRLDTYSEMEDRTVPDHAFTFRSCLSSKVCSTLHDMYR